MYKIKKHISISAAHNLKLSYESKCKALHGHNWEVDVFLQAEELDKNGMVLDFTTIKNKLMILDHTFINDVIEPLNPTAENIAKWICDELGEKCYKVEIAETPGNIVIYERGNHECS